MEYKRPSNIQFLLLELFLNSLKKLEAEVEVISSESIEISDLWSENIILNESSINIIDTDFFLKSSEKKEKVRRTNFHLVNYTIFEKLTSKSLYDNYLLCPFWLKKLRTEIIGGKEKLSIFLREYIKYLGKNNEIDTVQDLRLTLKK